MIIDRVDEEFLLFSLRPNGRWASRWTGSVSAGVAGAWILDLLLEGRIRIHDGRIEPRGKSSLDDPVLDSILDQIRAARRPRKVATWVTRLSRRTGRRTLQVMHRLEERGFVERHGRRFPQHSPGGRRDIRQHLLEVIQGRQIPGDETIALLGLLEAAGMTRFVFRGHARQARRAIARLVEGHERVATVAHAVRRRRLRRFLPLV
ncbi:MAG TPA: GPP34 family phosphoprotein [Candidatus Thermoplasmatota archaeon]|nr:GPP34 family phosphoprotein [Candidatus Thermoplasmatota archaeon]